MLFGVALPRGKLEVGRTQKHCRGFTVNGRVSRWLLIAVHRIDQNNLIYCLADGSDMCGHGEEKARGVNWIAAHCFPSAFIRQVGQFA